jgi:(p)ppGpp synthase/HD superfamily hydrolase
MNKQEQLSKAILIATEALDGQFDKGGKPYILHPLHFMKQLKQLMFDVQLATIAVLHDVVEDSDITIEDLEEYGFSYRVLHALELLTHKSNDTYFEYIDKISGNYDAIRVKRKDLQHNLDVTRLKDKYQLSEKDMVRIAKYNKAFIILTKAKRDFERK